MSETKRVTLTVTHPGLAHMSREDRAALAHREAEAYCRGAGHQLISNVVGTGRITISEARGGEQSMTVEFEVIP